MTSENRLAELGFPLVLKADGTSGGDGVRISSTLEEADTRSSSCRLRHFSRERPSGP